MLLVELVDNDARLRSDYCMKCEQPVSPEGKAPTVAERRHVFLTRLGVPIHITCILELAAELEAPLKAISEEFEARRRALTGE